MKLFAPPKKIVLMGQKHCGKSTLGRALAEQLSGEASFVDADDCIVERYQREFGQRLAVREIYRERGGEFFRRLEAETLCELAEQKPDAENRTRVRILALGGGAVSNEFLPAGVIAQLGLGIYLKIAPEIAYRRIAAEGLPPFLANQSNPYQAFLEQYELRDQAFSRTAALIYELNRERDVATESRDLATAIAESWDK